MSDMSRRRLSNQGKRWLPAFNLSMSGSKSS
jgi:hypothetical protein